MEDSQNSNQESIAGSIADEIDLWKTLFEPEFYTSLSDPFGPITLEIQYFAVSPIETGEEPTEVIEVAIFPFYTINDIKLAIYNQKKNQAKFAPQFQFLAEYTEETEKYQALDAYYLEPSSKKPLSFDDPLAAGKNKAFVDDGGNKKTLNFVSRSRTLYEDTYLYAKKEPILRLFLLSDIVEEKETFGNEVRYLGYIKPYFNSDYISNTTKGDTVPADQAVELKRSRDYFSARELLLKKTIEPSVAKFTGDVNLRIEGIKSLRLVWLHRTDGKTVDALFYEQSVDQVRPFLRLLPKDSTPVTKLHVVKGPVPAPDIADPCLILQWAREKNPAPKNDFLFGKIDIGDEYATLQVLNDGTAAVVVQPRKGQRQFEAESAELFRQRIQQGISGFPFATEDPQLNEMSFQASITIKGDKIERREMSKRLEAFGSFFQEIPPPPNSPSLMSLRYKAISNFYAQDRVQLFLSQLLATKIAPEAIITKTAEAFEITLKQAQMEYQEFVTRAEEIIPVVPKYSVFRLKYNPGIDINITAHHPTYTFQIERVDSITNLQRVLTLLSVMMTYPIKKPAPAAAIATLAKAVAFEEAGQEAPKAAPAPVDESKSKLSIANYFIKRLQQADPTLFGFGEGQTTQNGYGQMCQFAQMRQPAVLGEKQYQRTLELYATNITNNEVEFIEVSYKNPVPSGDSKLADTYAKEKEIDDNTFSVLKYGTTLKDQRYYICSEYFCIEDEIPLMPSEFEEEGVFRPEADEEFKGKPKLANHCPFCNGRLIDTKKKKDPGATVYKREKMKYVGFMNKDAHPAHWGLPCCFTKRKFTSKGKFIEFFKKQREEEKKSGPIAPETEATEEATEAAQEEEDAYDEDADIEGINYEDVLNRTHERTVVKDTKFPLELKGGEPQLGLIPNVLDAFFHQNPEDLVTKGMTMRMKPISEGFFRIAADNRLSRRPESFFAAIAPFFKKNSATDVRLRLRELFGGPAGVKLFTSINFGNLMLEFYMPTLSNEQYTAAELTRFAVKNLNPKRSQQYPYIARIKKSYDNFMNFLNNPKKLKEYRQFAHLLAQPNIFMPALITKQGVRIDRPGILFVVIEMTDDTNYTIRCPPFGVTETMESCDIGFLIHREEIWEPLFFLKNSVDSRGFARHIHTMRVKSDNTQSPQLPASVVDAIQTFRTKCANEAPTVYTGIQQLAQPENRLPTLTSLIGLLSEIGTFVGVIRDVYNHVVAVTFKIDEDNEIAFPVIDDGFMQSQNSLVIYFGWEGFTAAPVEIAWSFYEENEAKFAEYPGYKPQRIIRLPYGKTKAIKAIQFENGIFVPVSDANVAEDEIPGKIEDLTEIEFEWTINEKIGRPTESASDKKTGDKKTVSITKEIETENDVEEIFQHFRLSVSNWLLSKEGTPWKNKIQEIIMPASQTLGYTLSVGRKRELLQMLLAERMKRFIDTDHEPESKVPSVVRVDCRKLTQGDCTASNRCVWRPDEKRCLLHVKALPDVDKTDMSKVFLLRLIEELIRFPRRRAQILQERNRRIGTLSKLSGAVRMIDQYIVPDDTSEWAELMNMDCKKRTPEIPHFFEEFSREEGAKQAVVKPDTPLEASSLPDFVLNLLEGDDATYELVPFETERKGDQSRYDILEYGLTADPKKEPPFVDDDIVEEMIGMFEKPETGFAIFNDGDDTPRGLSGVGEYAYLVFYIDGAYSFLVKKGEPISPITIQTLPDTLQEAIVTL
jgi:hypothetical protein